MAKTRYIKFKDKEVTLGFDYPLNKYYVINERISNHPSSTYRKREEDILRVLLALGITEIENITETENIPILNVDGQINPKAIKYIKQNLKDILEEIEKNDEDYTLYYTLDDNNSYVRTVQFNEWEDYPMEVDCSKGNIFIRGTNTLYSLDIKEDPTIRIRHFQSFYTEKLGLFIEEYIIRGIYYLLANQYLEPNFYNQIIEEESGVLLYNNVFVMANYTNSSPIVCSGVRDPYNEDPSIHELRSIVSVNNSEGTIHLQKSIIKEDSETRPEEVRVGSKINISNSSFTQDGVEYTADGNYTISSINEEGNIITVTEPITASVNPPTCYIQSAKCTIQSMSREDNRITVSDGSLENILVGDVINVEDASVGEGYDEVNCNGAYTVSSLSGNDIYVTEQIPTDYTAPSTPKAFLYKEVFVGNIVKVTTPEESTGSTLILEKTPENNIVPNSIIYIHDRSGNWDGKEYKVKEQIDKKITLTSKVEIEFPSLGLVVPSETININITSVADYLQDYVSIGSFTLNDFSESQQYIDALRLLDEAYTNNDSKIPSLEDDTGERLYNKVEKSLKVKYKDLEAIPNKDKTFGIYFKNLYSKVYGDSASD